MFGTLRVVGRVKGLGVFLLKKRFVKISKKTWGAVSRRFFSRRRLESLPYVIYKLRKDTRGQAAPKVGEGFALKTRAVVFLPLG